MNEALPKHAIGACGCGSNYFTHEGPELFCCCCLKWSSGRQTTFEEIDRAKDVLEELQKNSRHVGQMQSLQNRMKEKNVTMLREEPLALQCNSCGQVWYPNLQPGGNLPRRYWKCPNGCN